jgi:hypothetical protein
MNAKVAERRRMVDDNDAPPLRRGYAKTPAAPSIRIHHNLGSGHG